MLVLLNPDAGGGTAGDRWRDTLPAVRRLLGPFAVRSATRESASFRLVAGALATGERSFVAAGGDGTVNLLVNSLLRTATPAVLDSVKLGAIGLGSSNDFHKPLTHASLLHGIPHKLDFATTRPHDVAQVGYEDPHGKTFQRYWLVNASTGVTAEGNELFNHPGAGLRLVKRISPTLGMTCAAARAILTHRPRWLTIALDDGPPARLLVSNLGVVKNPHFTGSLHYHNPYQPDSGRFFVHVLEGVGFAGLLRALFQLARGKFHGSQMHTSQATRVTLEADAAFPLEADGEIVWARRASFSILPRAVRICT